MNAQRYLVLAMTLLSMGISAPTIRYAVAAPLAVGIWRLIFSWPLLAGVSLKQGERWPLAQAAGAGFFLALHWLCWVIAVQRTTIANASLLVSTGALWSALLSRPLLGETISVRHWVGLGLALLGITLVLLARPGGNHSVAGDLFALAGAFAWVGYAFVGRRARQHAGFWGYTAAVYGATGVFMGGAAFLCRTPLIGYSPTTWMALVVLALFPTLLGHGGINYLLGYMGPARLALWVLSEPVFATIYAVWLFGEVPTLQIIIGGVATLGGISLGTSTKLAGKDEQGKDEQALEVRD
ncbi:MAG: DMT family transporter [Deltaproteobacteria bacterium]|nr:DMT family transporter [Deltaproteobacteria bacterium]